MVAPAHPLAKTLTCVKVANSPDVTYNRYAGFLKQLFDIAVKDRIIPDSPAKLLRQGWKKPKRCGGRCPP